MGDEGRGVDKMNRESENFKETQEHDPYPLSKEEEDYIKVVRKTCKRDVWKMTKEYFIKNHPKLAKQIANCKRK